MRELINDPFNKLIEEYDRCVIDYCLMEDDTPYQGYPSHKDAIQFAMQKVIERDTETQIEVELLRTDRVGRRFYDCEFPDPLKGEQIPYWYAFLEPPHTSGYGPDDFRSVNSVLFPKGVDQLEIYEWTTDWSDYFDDGHEWWGTACWSIYDKRMNRYVVIMAEATD